MIAYKRPKNLKDLIIRAKIPKLKNNKTRKIFGMKKCQKSCLMGPFVSEVKEKSTVNFKWKIRNKYNCDTENIEKNQGEV